VTALGFLIQLPDAFLRSGDRQIASSCRPRPDAVGMVFLPREPAEAAACQRLFEMAASELGHQVLGWREVPTNPTGLGKTALESRPTMAQVFVDRPATLTDDAAFERRLVLIRRTAEKLVRTSDLGGRKLFYVASLSCRTLVYKGMLNADQLDHSSLICRLVPGICAGPGALALLHQHLPQLVARPSLPA